MSARTFLAFAVALTAALAANATSAATQQRTIIQLATGLCGANNPANDPHLRRLPVGLRNTGSASNVSVVCSQWGDDDTAAAVSGVALHLRNDRTSTVSVTCTLSMGTPYYTQNVVTRSRILSPGEVGGIQWDYLDIGTNASMQWVNLQCSLPQAVSMREIVYVYYENVGA